MRAAHFGALCAIGLLAFALQANGQAAQADVFMRGLATGVKHSGSLIVGDADPSAAPDLWRGYGVANYELNVPFKKEFASTIGSNTKFMTAVAIWQLQQRGLLHVDDLVTKYVNGSDFGKPQGWTWCPKVYNTTGTGCAPVTIRHMMTMASGLLRYDNCPYTPSDWQFKYCIVQQPGGEAFSNDVYVTITAQISIEQIILKGFLDSPLEFEPGTQYAYSNAGWVLGGYIVEKVTGMSISQYYQKYVWDPSGMKDTYYGPGQSMYGVKKGTVDDPGYVSLFAPFGALLKDPSFSRIVMDPRAAVGNGNVYLPPHKPAGTFQGMVRTPWYNGELVEGGAAGAVISTATDMLRWYRTFLATPQKLGLNDTTLNDMFSVYNKNQAIPNFGADGNKTIVTGYFGPGIAVVPGPGGKWNLSQLLYQGDIGAVACRVLIKLRQPIQKSTIIVFWSTTTPGIPKPDKIADDGTTDCMVTDPLYPSLPAEKLPEPLCTIATYPWTQYISLKLTQLWKF